MAPSRHACNLVYYLLILLINLSSMDHWPIPCRPVRPRTKVFVPRDADYSWPFGEVDFHTYPESQGWWKAKGDDEDFITPDDRPLQRPSYTEKPGANQFLMKWAYFGLLSEVMQVAVYTTTSEPPVKGPWEDPWSWLKSFAFTPLKNPLMRVDSLDVPTILQDFIRKTRRETQAERSVNNESEARAWASIQTTISWLKRMRDYETPVFDPDLMLAIEAQIDDLVRTIHLAYEVITPSQPGDARLYSHRRHPQAPLICDPMSSGVLRSRMLADGWCPSNLKRIFDKTPSLSSHYFLSMLDRPRPHLRHGEDCNKDYCRHWKVDMETYTTAHICDRGDCRWVTVPLQRLEEILALDDDTIPVIVPGVTDTAEDDRIVARLETGSKETEYVAISHVWSDGLGNTTANEIPICQFEKLSKMVQDAWGDSKICFWLDTLCFPYPTSPDKEAYQQALEKMRATYEQAELVLVLDSYLRNTQYEPSVMNDHELALRVLCSEWSARLWTYQEGRLAKRLKFVFGNTAVEIPFAILDNPISANDEIWSSFESNRVVRPASLVGEYSREKMADLRKVYAELSYRATSVAEDESLCLANLMGIDPRVVTRVPSSKRMEVVWRHADPVDAFTTLFWPCQRLKVNGLGWAPSSLLTRECLLFSSFIPSGSQILTLSATATGDIRSVQQTALRAKQDPRGLMFKCSYAILTGVQRSLCRRFVCGGLGMDWYRVDLTYDIEGRSVDPTERGRPLPLPQSYGPLRHTGPWFLLFPQVQETSSPQQLLPENIAVLCYGRPQRLATLENGWQDHGLVEVQSVGIVRVSRYSLFKKENRMTVYSPVKGDNGMVNYLWEQIEENNGHPEYSTRWRAKAGCDSSPEEQARIRANIPTSYDPKDLPPQRLVFGQPATMDIIFLMR